VFGRAMTVLKQTIWCLAL